MGINPDHTEVWAVPGVATNGSYCQAAKNKYSNLHGPLVGKHHQSEIPSANTAHTLSLGQSQDPRLAGFSETKSLGL